MLLKVHNDGLRKDWKEKIEQPVKLCRFPMGSDFCRLYFDLIPCVHGVLTSEREALGTGGSYGNSEFIGLSDLGMGGARV